MVWWTILLRGEMRANETLEREVLAARGRDISAQQRTDRLAEIAAHHDRRNVMLVGESTLLALLLSGSLVVLFLLAQRRKQQREDMEKLLQFTSHEFKTPVAGVKGLLQSLAIGSIPDAQRAELIHLGQLECDRLEHLAETILAYQRAMARDPHEGVQPFDARALHRRSAGASRAHREQRRAPKSRRSSAMQVLADRDGLRVILENLLDNAHKYGGGSVRLSAAVADGRWRLDISDQGRGFPPESAEKLFDLHNRGSGEGVTHGAGLGLAIARQLARRMGGDITARSPGPGQGAVFSVTLVTAPAATRPSPMRARRMVERIAIVEDERLVRELVAVNLRHAGYDIVAAENFEQGKQLLAKQDFQLAILDVMLPGGDGFALTRFARDQGVNAPILMLTARSDTTSKVRGLDAGADDYLPKPFDVNELLARVRALLRRASGRPASAPPRLASRTTGCASTPGRR